MKVTFSVVEEFLDELRHEQREVEDSIGGAATWWFILETEGKTWPIGGSQPIQRMQRRKPAWVSISDTAPAQTIQHASLGCL
jgi:hypothetical protein